MTKITLEKSSEPANSQTTQNPTGLELLSGNVNEIFQAAEGLVEENIYAPSRSLDIAQVDRGLLENIAFAGGIRAIWQGNEHIYAADNTRVYYFKRAAVAGNKSYLLVTEAAILKSPNRIEYEQFGQKVFLYACYPDGSILRAYIKNSQWVLDYEK